MDHDSDGSTAYQPADLASARAWARQLMDTRDQAHQLGRDDSQLVEAYDRLVQQQGYDPLGPDAPDND